MMSGPWHDMAHVGSRRPFTKQALAQSQAKQRGICGGEFGTGMGFPSSTSVFPYHYHPFGARGGAVGRGTALQAGRSQVRFPVLSLEFFIDIILPAALCP